MLNGMAPCHGTIGPRQCVSLPYIMHDMFEETSYHNNIHVKKEHQAFPLHPN